MIAAFLRFETNADWLLERWKRYQIPNIVFIPWSWWIQNFLKKVLLHFAWTKVIVTVSVGLRFNLEEAPFDLEDV